MERAVKNYVEVLAYVQFVSLRNRWYGMAIKKIRQNFDR